MRILLSSLCAILLIGCASYPKRNGFQSVETIQKETLNPYFSDVSKDYVYKAKIKAFDKSFGGLLIVKKISSAHHRIVFTTEMGNTIFDFTFQGTDFKVNRILNEMNRQLLINILKRDFRALTEEHPPVLRTFRNAEDMVTETELLSKKHYFYHTDGSLKKIVRAGNGKENVVFLFSETKDDVTGNVQIIHRTFPMTITLNSI